MGSTIVRYTPGGIIKLKIVETEAYHQHDPASHSFKWRTARTAPMFEAGGTIYVYFTYGMHYAINIVTGKKGTGEAVLLRAAEPLDGLQLMKQNRRGITDIRNLANVKDSPLWVNNQHITSEGMASCGRDLSDVIDKSPHGRGRLLILPKIGQLVQ